MVRAFFLRGQQHAQNRDDGYKANIHGPKLKANEQSIHQQRPSSRGIRRDQSESDPDW